MGRQFALDKVISNMAFHEVATRKMPDLYRVILEHSKVVLGHHDKW